MGHLCELSSSLGNCYWLFLSHYTGTEKTFRLTWQNLPRRRQRVLHAWLGTMRWAGTNHLIFHAGREKSENNWWCFINDERGLQVSPTAIKPPGCVLLLTTAHWLFRRNKQRKAPPRTMATSRKLLPSHQLVWKHGQNNLNKQHWEKMEGKASVV